MGLTQANYKAVCDGCKKEVDTQVAASPPPARIRMVHAGWIAVTVSRSLENEWVETEALFCPLCQQRVLSNLGIRE